MWLRLKDPGLSYIAFERLIDYFASNPRRRRVLGTETGVDVVRALLARAGPRRLRGGDPRVETCRGRSGDEAGKLA